MSARADFKTGFIKRCQVEGLTTEQILARIARATEYLEKRGGLVDWLNSFYAGAQAHPVPTATGKNAPALPARSDYWKSLGIAGLAATPLIAGAASGILASKLKGDYLDEEDIEKQELLNEFRRQTLLAKQRQSA